MRGRHRTRETHGQMIPTPITTPQKKSTTENTKKKENRMPIRAVRDIVETHGVRLLCPRRPHRRPQKRPPIVGFLTTRYVVMGSGHANTL
jgi:hypothetical protein